MKWQLQLLILCFISITGYANLPDMPVKFSLQASKASYSEGAPMEFYLTIRNTDKTKSYPIVLPKKNTSGQKLFVLKVYLNDGKSTAEIASDFSYSSYNNDYTKTVQLEPGKSVTIKLFVNHKRKEYGNDGRYHFLSGFLKQGNYSFRVFYNPYGIAASGLYNYINSTNDEVMPGKLTFWTTGNPSEPCYMTITPRNKHGMPKLSECGPNCKFCKTVEQQKWNKVKRLLNSGIKKQNSYNLNHCYLCNDSSWLYKHKTLNYLYTNNNVLDILPTAMYGQIGLQVKDTVFYFDMTYQLGKIYKWRSRLHQILYLTTRINLKKLKTSSLYYIELKNFTPAKQKYKPQ